MPKIESLEVIDLTSSLEDEQQHERIRELSQRVLAQEIPAYQVDVGDNIAGFLAVRSLVETTVNDVHGATLAGHGLPRWALTHETNHVQYARKRAYTIANTLAPHRDVTFHGLAVHRNYFSPKPVPVQFGFSDAATPEDDPSFNSTEHYPGSRTAADYVDTVWEGETVSGRLTVFSQGDEGDVFGGEAAVHFFDRRNLPWEGVYTRYACHNVSNIDWVGIPYEDFVAMRTHTTTHLDYARWQTLAATLPEHKDKVSPAEYDEMYQRVEQQVASTQQYSNFKFWTTYAGINNEIPGMFSYGVLSPEYPETRVVDPYILRAKDPNAPILE